MPDQSISAIVAVYNGERFLSEALESIFSQTRPVDEVIVVDDGSTDGTASLAKSFPVKYLRQEHAGQAVALNVGIEASTGGFLAFLDADDRWVAHRIERQLSVFEEEPTIDLLYGHAEQFFDTSNPAAGEGRSPAHPIMPAYLPASLLARRAAFETVGPFSGRTGQMVDWYARAVEAGVNIRMLNDVLFHRRIHDDNIGIRERSLRDGYLAVIRAALGRRAARSELR